MTSALYCHDLGFSLLNMRALLQACVNIPKHRERLDPLHGQMCKQIPATNVPDMRQDVAVATGFRINGSTNHV